MLQAIYYIIKYMYFALEQMLFPFNVKKTNTQFSENIQQ